MTNEQWNKAMEIMQKLKTKRDPASLKVKAQLFRMLMEKPKSEGDQK